MSTEDFAEKTSKSRSKKKSKAAASVPDEPIDETFDAMLDSASKAATMTASNKSKTVRHVNQEGAGSWSNEMNIDQEITDVPLLIPSMHPMSRRPPDEIVAAGIPTIHMDDAEMDDTPQLTTQLPDVPEFSIHQIATFKDMENEFSRERAGQFIDPKIDIGILYQNLNLQEELDSEEKKPWDWDKLFVEVRNSIANPIIG